MGVPLRVGLSAISFLPVQDKKKDAAAIPNAAFKYRNIQQTTQTSVVHIKSPFFARENSIVTQQPLSEIP